MISFILSVYDREAMLSCCMTTLFVQDQRNVADIIVCDNSPNGVNADACNGLQGVEYWHTGGSCKNCYESANEVYEEATGDWLCFPSDDSLYVCQFATIMLATAQRTGADLVYCDCVYKGGETANPNWKPYTILDVQPKMGRIDKTCFILRRELFHGFPPHPRGWSDGALIEQLVRDGVKHAKAPGVLVVHQ